MMVETEICPQTPYENEPSTKFVLRLLPLCISRVLGAKLNKFIVSNQLFSLTAHYLV